MNHDKPTCSAVCEDDKNKNCFCPKGYRKDGLLCHKQNPCLTNQGGCDQICTFDSAKDSVQCSCNEGYNLGLCFRNYKESRLNGAHGNTALRRPDRDK